MFAFIDTMIFDIEVQSYPNINWIVNFHIDKTQLNDSKTIPDMLLLVEVNKINLQRNNNNKASSTKAGTSL